MKREFIGYEACRQDLIKPQYRQFAEIDKCDLVAIHIYKDETAKYGIVVELHDWFYSSHLMWHPELTEEEKKSQKERIEAYEKEQAERKAKGLPDKVDTSNWVKPDEETLRRELIEKFVMCELLIEDTNLFRENFAKAEILYSVLHTTSPSNPQILTNYAIDIPDALESVLSELKHKDAGASWRLMDNCKDADGKFEHEKYLYEVTAWRERLKSDIIKPIYKRLDKNPFEEYFKENPIDAAKAEEITKKLAEENVDHAKWVEKCEAIKKKAVDENAFAPAWNRVNKDGVTNENKCPACGSKDIHYISTEDFVANPTNNTECENCDYKFNRT